VSNEQEKKLTKEIIIDCENEWISIHTKTSNIYISQRWGEKHQFRKYSLEIRGMGT
jgi:hypothetical protein